MDIEEDIYFDAGDGSNIDDHEGFETLKHGNRPWDFPHAKKRIPSWT